MANRTLDHHSADLGAGEEQGELGATLCYPLLFSKKWIWLQRESNFQGLQGGSDLTLYQEPPDLGAVIEQEELGATLGPPLLSSKKWIWI